MQQNLWTYASSLIVHHFWLCFLNSFSRIQNLKKRMWPEDLTLEMCNLPLRSPWKFFATRAVLQSPQDPPSSPKKASKQGLLEVAPHTSPFLLINEEMDFLGICMIWALPHKILMFNIIFCNQHSKKLIVSNKNKTTIPKPKIENK